MQVSETDVNKSSLLKVDRDAHKEAGGFVANEVKIGLWIHE